MGSVDDWIKEKLQKYSCVTLEGAYTKESFSAMANGSDVALFLSPWKETFCIAFDEWAAGGRPAFYYSIGALSEKHRQENLNTYSRSFAPRDINSIFAALIDSCKPKNLADLRNYKYDNNSTNNSSYDFGEEHWKLYRSLLKNPSPPYPSIWPLGKQRDWTNRAELNPPILLRPKFLRRCLTPMLKLSILLLGSRRISDTIQFLRMLKK